MMGSSLVKTRTVLVITDASEWPEYLVRFRREIEEDERPYVLDLPYDVWTDFDRPDTITVTIKPGDHLNPEES